MQDQPLPYDEGAEAYKKRQTFDSNPYEKSDWRSDEWDKGWMAANDKDVEDNYDWNTGTFKATSAGGDNEDDIIDGGFEYGG